MYGVETAAKAVCEEFDVEMADLMSPSRGVKDIALARQVWMWVLSNGRTYTQVGTAVERDRTTVTHACSIVSMKRRAEPEFLEQTNRVLRLLQK